MHQKRLWVSIASRFLFSSNIRPDAKRFVKHEFQRFVGQHNIGIDLRENSASLRVQAQGRIAHPVSEAGSLQFQRRLPLQKSVHPPRRPTFPDKNSPPLHPGRYPLPARTPGSSQKRRTVYNAGLSSQTPERIKFRCGCGRRLRSWNGFRRGFGRRFRHRRRQGIFRQKHRTLADATGNRAHA